MKYMIGLVLLCCMTVAAADYERYVSKVVEYSECAERQNTSFSGGLKERCINPGEYDPCATTFSGGPECKQAVINSCAVYLTKTQDLHIIGAVLYDGGDLAKPVIYTKMHYHPELNMFSLEEFR